MIEKLLVKKLMEKGVPGDAMIFEWRRKAGEQPLDLVVMAKDYNTPVSIFEIKHSKTSLTIDKGINQLKTAAQTIGRPIVLCYLVFPKDSDNIEIFDVTDAVYNGVHYKHEKFYDSLFSCDIVTYEEMQKGFELRNLVNNVHKRDETVIFLKRLCFWIIPLYCLLVLILDGLGFFHITYERLWVHGGIVVMTLLPFFKEISLGPVIAKLNAEDKDKKK